jgi:uncharacterized phage protein (TIGR02218 family)
MAKSISSALAAHLAGEVTTLATCWRVTRKDGREFFFTDHDRDLAFDGNLYLASSGYSRSAIANDAGMAVDNLDVEGVLDHEQISEQDLRAGLFDHAEVHVFLVNWSDLAQGKLRLRRGWFGEVHLTDQGLFRTELRGMTQALSVRIGELYSPECRADLGDPRCRVPIEAPVVARGTSYAASDRVRVPTATMGVATVAVPFVNAGFDAGSLSGWTVVSGSASAKTANSPLVPHAGSHFLEGNSVAAFEVLQTVDMTGLIDANQADAGAYLVSFACQRANGATDTADQGRVIVDLLDAAGAVLATILDTGPESFDPAGLWHLRAVASAAVPAGTRKIRVRFLGQRVNGSVCNAALDTVSASFTNPAAPLKGSAVYENRLYRCITAGTTAAEQPAYDTTIGAETTDGTAVFVAENAWSRAGTVTEVLDRVQFTAAIDEPRAADGWFDGGVLTWETGDNAGRAIEVKSWAQASGQITLFLPPGYPIRPGDVFRVHPGCDKRLDTCVTRFANVLNFRGEPYVPGQDEMMKYPDAK